MGKTEKVLQASAVEPRNLQELKHIQAGESREKVFDEFAERMGLYKWIQTLLG